MNFSILNFGQRFHILDNEELKNRIRNFEKQKKQIISDQYRMLFNQTCLNEELYPTYSDIYIMSATYKYIYRYIVIIMIIMARTNNFTVC